MAAPELKTLGRYNIERVLGKGAMGVVYEGVDPRLGRRVAIKTILKSHLDEDTAKDYSMRFVREAQAVARLNHPNIVQVYDFGEEGEIAYLVMEFIKGKELKNFFDANERFDLKEAVRIMCELCDALDFAHQHGIVHRDIKPANVMLDHQARTKLTDFGVARVTDSDKTSVERTQAGTMVGTPAYMSPEQITGANIDRRTDVFSAGIILYQFLTGEKPFTGSGAWTIAKKIIQEEPPLPSSVNNAVTSLFDAVVNKALAKNPDNRYQSARDLSVALRRALEGKPEEDDEDRTIVGALSEPIAPVARSAPAGRSEATRGGATSGSTQAGNQEVELEFWRAIKDGNDPEDFELYVQQFPTGIYAALAKRKIAKLRGVAPEETGAKAKEQEKKEAEEAAKREAEVRSKLAAEKEKLEAELKRKEEEYRKREAEAEAKRLAAEKARIEAEEKARREAEEKARQAAEKAKQEAAAEREQARQEAEKAKQEAERAKQEALAAARAEAEKARKEAEEQARREAEKAKQEAAAERERVRQEAEQARKEAEARAKKEAEERAKREVEFKKREAELKKQAAAGGKKGSPAVPIAVGVVLLLAGTVGYFFLPQQDPQATAKLQAMQRQLEEAKQKAAELETQKKKEEQARLALEKARRDEEAARKAGDLKRQQEMAQARAQAEAEARRQADVTKLREAEARKTADAAEAARRQAEAKKQAEAKAAEQKALAEKLAAEKALTEKLARERAAVEAERQRLAAEKAAAEKPAAEARAAADKAAAERAAAEKEKAKLAAVSVAPAAPGGEALREQAEAAEEKGNGKEAVKLYTRAARSGNGKAAKRLGEIYDKGLAGIPRDYAESLKWYNAARVLGEEVPLARGR
jgi:serine/threonine-protein kinase